MDESGKLSSGSELCAPVAVSPIMKSYIKAVSVDVIRPESLPTSVFFNETTNKASRTLLVPLKLL